MRQAQLTAFERRQRRMAVAVAGIFLGCALAWIAAGLVARSLVFWLAGGAS